MPDNKTINEVRDIREKLGITQKRLAEMLGVSEKTVQNWEYGKNIPKTKHQKLRELIIVPQKFAGGGLPASVQNDDEIKEPYSSDVDVSNLIDTVKMQQQSLMKAQEQIDKLLEIIDNLTNN